MSSYPSFDRFQRPNYPHTSDRLCTLSTLFFFLVAASSPWSSGIRLYINDDNIAAAAGANHHIHWPAVHQSYIQINRNMLTSSCA